MSAFKSSRSSKSKIVVESKINENFTVGPIVGIATFRLVDKDNVCFYLPQVWMCCHVSLQPLQTWRPLYSDQCSRHKHSSHSNPLLVSHEHIQCTILLKAQLSITQSLHHFIVNCSLWKSSLSQYFCILFKLTSNKASRTSNKPNTYSIYRKYYIDFGNNFLLPRVATTP